MKLIQRNLIRTIVSGTFLFAPACLPVSHSIDDARTVAHTFLNLIDRGDYAGAYLLAAEDYQRRVSYMDFLGMNFHFRKNLAGDFRRRGQLMESHSAGFRCAIGGSSKLVWSGRFRTQRKDGKEAAELLNIGKSGSRYAVLDYRIGDVPPDFDPRTAFETDSSRAPVRELISETESVLEKAAKEPAEYGGMLIEKIELHDEPLPEIVESLMNAIIRKDTKAVADILSASKYTKDTPLQLTFTLSNPVYVGRFGLRDPDISQIYNRNYVFETILRVDGRRLNATATIQLDSKSELVAFDIRNFIYVDKTRYLILNKEFVRLLLERFREEQH